MTVFGSGVFTGNITPFTGATNTTDGTEGGVPKPLAGQQNDFLRGDGTWAAAAGPTGYTTIENSGVAVAQQTTFNFATAGVTAVNNAGSNRTDISLAAPLVDVAGLTPSAHSVITGNGSNFVDTVPSITNVYYVAKNGNDVTGNGSQLFPYLTIGAACTAIGNAANNAALIDPTQRYYVIEIEPGVYTEAVTVPNRPYVLFKLNGAQINGNVVQNFDGTLFGGAITTAKVIFQGYDLIGLHTGLSEAVNDITGNVTINRTAGPFNFNALQFINTGVSGNVIADGAVAYTLLLYTENTNIGGNVVANQATINVNLYAENCNTPGTTGIGGCTGPGQITLRNLRNVAFNGVVTTSTASAAFNWDNVSFAAVAHNFTGLTSNIVTDSASYQSYVTNVPTKGSETFTFRDSAKGINAQYTPSHYTAVNSTVQGNLQGIDNALASAGSFTWNPVAGTSQTLAKNNGYFVDNAALTTFTLPATAARGDTYKIIGIGAGGWTVAQNAGQNIDFNGASTSVGVGGHMDSTGARNTVEIVCTAANTSFEVFATNAPLNLV